MLHRRNRSRRRGTQRFIGGNDRRTTRAEVECPITGEIFADPVRRRNAPRAHAYERTAVEQWLRSGRNTSPLTRARMQIGDLVPDNAARERTAAYLENHPEERADQYAVPSPTEGNDTGSNLDPGSISADLDRMIDPRSWAVEDDVTDYEAAEPFRYVIDTEHPLMATPPVLRSVTFNLGATGGSQHTLQFREPVSELDAVRAAERFLSQSVSRAYHDLRLSRGDVRYPEDWREGYDRTVVARRQNRGIYLGDENWVLAVVHRRHRPHAVIYTS